MERRALFVAGIVQGVGFRPFVYRLAARLQIAGFVRNQAGRVHIEVEGASTALDQFTRMLLAAPPPLARIDDLRYETRPLRGEDHFAIQESVADDAQPIAIAPDIATCDDCLRELHDPSDRRRHYPFINCTNCGPRLTIVEAAPYDRGRTTMAGFAMCPECEAEYANPADRRFHAQPIACPRCGPRLRLLDAAGREQASADPLVDFSQLVRSGGIGALKGLGGYHLVCDASNAHAVESLRGRKHREAKPFAVMVRSVEQAAELCALDTAERALLCRPRRPIVLLRRRDVPIGNARAQVAAAVAHGNPYLGLMLPYTPLHHLLLDAAGGVPLVMTSGNRADEPIAYQDDQAIEQLSGIADVFLAHNRPIHVRCDDSVTRVIDGREYPLRRSRGDAPQPLELPCEARRPLLATGGQLKATFALAHGRRAIVSHHLGDLDHLQAFRGYQRDVELYEQLFGIRPELIVHDLHPDYATSAYAHARAAEQGQQLMAVQHHHAHAASCMAEHGLRGRVIAVVFDGTGYGPDGTIWGGEFLLASYRRFRRAAHLRCVPLPGGDAAIREPWRVGLSHLMDAEVDTANWFPTISASRQHLVRQMLARRVNCPLASSAGRLFDAVAALLGLRTQVQYEAQAAIELEWLASDLPPEAGYPFKVTPADTSQRPLEVDTRPLVRAVAADVQRGVETPRIARRFQSTLADVIASVCQRLRDSAGLNAVVLSGGVFLNVLLLQETTARLTAAGFRVYRHRLVPTNDGGLSLGQAAIAAARQLRPRSTRRGDVAVRSNT